MWINFVLWEGWGRGKRECYFWGSPAGRGSFVGKLSVDCCCLCHDLFFFFSVFSGGLLWCKRLMALGSCPVQDGEWIAEPLPPRPAVKEQTHWLQYTAVRKRWLQMISKTWFLCFQTKTIGGDASSQLSQSTGVYSSGYQISIWRGWEGRSGVNTMVVSEVSSQICKYSIPDKFK